MTPENYFPVISTYVLVILLYKLNLIRSIKKRHKIKSLIFAGFVPMYYPSLSHCKRLQSPSSGCWNHIDVAIRTPNGEFGSSLWFIIGFVRLPFVDSKSIYLSCLNHVNYLHPAFLLLISASNLHFLTTFHHLQFLSPFSHVKSSFFTTKIPGHQGALAWREACSESWSSAEVPGRRQIHG